MRRRGCSSACFACIVCDMFYMEGRGVCGCVHLCIHTGIHTHTHTHNSNVGSALQPNTFCLELLPLLLTVNMMLRKTLVRVRCVHVVFGKTVVFVR